MMRQHIRISVFPFTTMLGAPTAKASPVEDTINLTLDVWKDGGV